MRDQGWRLGVVVDIGVVAYLCGGGVYGGFI